MVAALALGVTETFDGGENPVNWGDIRGITGQCPFMPTTANRLIWCR